MKRFYAVTVNLFLSLILGSAIAAPLQVNELIPTAGIFLVTLIPQGAQGVVLYASSLDLSALPAKMKDYALKDTEEILTKTLVDDMSFTDYMTMLTDITDEVPLTEFVIEDILQPGGKDSFNPTNNALKFKARTGKVRDCKVDLQFKPTQILNMYRSYMGKVKGGNIDPSVLPFEAYFQERIIAKAKDNLRKKALYAGVYNASGTAPVDVMDGINTLISDAIDDTYIPAGNIFAGAPITGSNALDQIEGVADKVSSEYDGSDLVCIISPTVMKYYNRDYRSSFTASPQNTKFEKQYIDGTTIELIPEIGLAGSDKVIITPRGNLFWLVGALNSQDAITIEKALRNLNYMMDFRAAPEIGIAELVWTNDQD